jgi:multimeric flavodoxin WrbA
MKVLVLDGTREDDQVLEKARQLIKNELEDKGCVVSSVILRSMNIAPCVGCFDCWLKTPGLCSINDEGRYTTREAVDSDIWIFLTPITFGGYSSELKKAVDRLLPVFVPIFTRINGEVHHRLRYDRHPIIIGIGGANKESMDYNSAFNNLVARNAINFRSPSYATGIIYGEESHGDMLENIKAVLSKAGIIR